MAKQTFDIEGMTCEHCVRAVKSALEAVVGVTRATVRIGHAEVEMEAEVSRDSLVHTIEEEGYRIQR